MVLSPHSLRHHSRLLSLRRLPFRVQSTSATADIPTTVQIVPSTAELCQSSDVAHDFDGSLVALLRARNLVEAVTNEDLNTLTEPLSAKRFKLYCGADPTASSLHLGNLLPLMVLLHFVIRGHDVVGLVGGATGAVGDPSGRTTERSLMEQQEREGNVQKIQAQILKFLYLGIGYARLRGYVSSKDPGTIKSVNNSSWWANVNFLDFLATYGRHIRVSQMLSRDSVLLRLELLLGIGFNEFAYQILQAYDFWHLFHNEGVNLQVGGNDQWGNITAGTDLILRLQKTTSDAEKQGEAAYGITVPLLTTPSGQKFGKLAGNAVFISTELTLPFQMYQFFINTADDMVGKLLKTLTLLPLTTIENTVLAKHERDPTMRIAQRVLAREVVDLIHGVGLGDRMAYITSFLFPTPDQPFDDDVTVTKLLDNFEGSGILQEIKLSSFKNPAEIRMSTLLAKITGKSKAETKNLIKSGAVYLGLHRDQFLDPEDVVLLDKENHLIDGQLLLLRVGKQTYHLVKVAD